MTWHDNDAFWLEMLPVLTSESMLQAAEWDATHAARLLQLDPGASILDMGCGPGRHSIAFAKRGFTVTGVDRTLPYLEVARQRAAEAQVDNIEFIHDSMLTFQRPATFDAATSLYTSFGYFENANEDRQALANIRTSLKPGGQIVIDVMSKEVLAGIFTPRDWQRLSNGRLYLRHAEVLPGWHRMRVEFLYAGGGRPEQSFQFEHNIYSGVELCALLTEAGFVDTAMFGGLEGIPYDRAALRLVVTARNPK